MLRNETVESPDIQRRRRCPRSGVGPSVACSARNWWPSGGGMPSDLSRVGSGICHPATARKPFGDVLGVLAAFYNAVCRAKDHHPMIAEQFVEVLPLLQDFIFRRGRCSQHMFLNDRTPDPPDLLHVCKENCRLSYLRSANNANTNC